MSLRQPSRKPLACLTLTAASLLVPSVALAASAPAPGTSTVVYVSAGDLVVKGSDGALLNFVVPPGNHLLAAGKDMTLAQIKPGMSLPEPVTAAATPKPVAAVSVIKGKVYSVAPPDGITLTLADGTKDYVVPAGTTFMVGGNPVPVADLKPGVMVEATVVTTAAAPAHASPATPPLTGALLLAKSADAEEDLPMAGTHLPAFGISGLLLMLLGAVTLGTRRLTAAR